MKTILNHDEHCRVTFNKCCVVTCGDVSFQHLGQHYRLTTDFFKKLEGLTVLVDSAFAVTRGGVQLGRATEV